MGERLCAGLPADWLNAWLAAIGALVLVPELKLHWSDDPIPLAVLTSAGNDDPAALITAAWPTTEDIASLPIARHLEGHRELTLNPSVDDWADRVAVARSASSGWTLTSLYTDLAWSKKDKAVKIERGQLHRSAPGGITAFERLESMVEYARQADLNSTLDGTARRVEANGLGFDVTRIGSLADDNKKMVDPCVEALAFQGLALFPTRGNGLQRRQRGWSQSTMAIGAFRWFTWVEPLDQAGIDALIDVATIGKDEARRAGVTASWEVVPFDRRSDSDPTGAYGSRRVVE